MPNQLKNRLQNDEISYQMRWLSHYLNSIASPPMLLVSVYLFLSPFAAEFIGQTSDFFVRGSPDDASPPHSFNFLAPSDVKLVLLRTKSCTRCFRLIQHESGGTAKRNMPFVVFSRGHGILHLAILIGTSVRRSVCLYPAA